MTKKKKEKNKETPPTIKVFGDAEYRMGIITDKESIGRFMEDVLQYQAQKKRKEGEQHG
jgi:hypothetical protein